MTSASLPLQTAAALTERFGPAYRWLVTVTGMMGVVSMVLAMTTVNALSEIAALMGDPARASMLSLLMDGRAHTAEHRPPGDQGDRARCDMLIQSHHYRWLPT